MQSLQFSLSASYVTLRSTNSIVTYKCDNIRVYIILDLRSLYLTAVNFCRLLLTLSLPGKSRLKYYCKMFSDLLNIFISFIR